MLKVQEVLQPVVDPASSHVLAHMSPAGHETLVPMPVVMSTWHTTHPASVTSSATRLHGASRSRELRKN